MMATETTAIVLRDLRPEKGKEVNPALPEALHLSGSSLQTSKRGNHTQQKSLLIRNQRQSSGGCVWHGFSIQRVDGYNFHPTR